MRGKREGVTRGDGMSEGLQGVLQGLLLYVHATAIWPTGHDWSHVLFCMLLLCGLLHDLESFGLTGLVNCHLPCRCRHAEQAAAVQRIPAPRGWRGLAVRLGCRGWRFRAGS